MFPREWEAFAAGVPAAERDGDLAAAYARLLADPDPAVTERAALRWCVWEDTHVSLAPGGSPWLQLAGPRLPAGVRPAGDALLGQRVLPGRAPIAAGMPRIADIPAVLVHGRYDVSGPLDTAWELHQAWPASRLVVVDDEGHGGDGMTSAMIEALDGFRAAR